MLSIGKLSGSGVAVSYYEKDDYYAGADAETSPEQAGAAGASLDTGGAGDGRGSGAAGEGAGGALHRASELGGAGSGAPSRSIEPGSQSEWFGRGARSLGLEGAVERETFQRVLDGVLPNGEVLGRHTPDGRQHAPGWDLTFSAPKSVSVLVEAGLDERLLRAHEAAARTALGWAQEHVIGTRSRRSGGLEFLRTRSMVAALFTHHTSRSQDPNLHTHAVVANVTERPDGSFGSVHSVDLFKSKMAIGLIYRAELARAALALGYEIREISKDGRFELAGPPSALLTDFSTRRGAVNAKLAQWDRSDPVAAARAALITRPSKQRASLADLSAAWRAHAETRSFDALQAVADARTRGAQPAPAGIAVKEALTEAIDKLSEREAAFAHADLVREVLLRSIGRVGIEDVERAICEARDTGVLKTAQLEGRRAWTTPRAATQERLALQTMLEAQQRSGGIMSAERVGEQLADRSLTTGQRRAVELILTSGDQYLGVVGRPGTGKTTMLKTVRELAESDGYRVIGMAQNANAAKTLQDEAGIRASTIHRHLRNIGEELAGVQKRGLIGSINRPLAQLRHRRDVWVVDEASQLPNNLTRRLMYAADKLGAKLVFVGDTKQLAAIEAGKPFALLLDRGMNHVEMDEIMRQRKPDDVRIVRDALEGRIKVATDRLADRTVEISDSATRLAAMLNRWKELGGRTADTLLITVRRHEKTQLNEGVRRILRDEGSLPGEVPRRVLDSVSGSGADRLSAEFYKPGQVVFFPRQVPGLGINRGEYLGVTAVDTASNTVQLSRAGSSDSLQWDPRRESPRGGHAPKVYEPRDTTLAPGEPVRWGQNNAQLELANGEILQTVSVTDSETVFSRANGQLVTVDAKAMTSQHWDHAYATTLYSAQGRTARNAVLNAESNRHELFSRKAFVVAVSRHRDDMFVFTNSRSEFTKNVDRFLGNKTSALEALSRVETDADRETARLPATAVPRTRSSTLEAPRARAVAKEPRLERPGKEFDR